MIVSTLHLEAPVIIPVMLGLYALVSLQLHTKQLHTRSSIDNVRQKTEEGPIFVVPFLIILILSSGGS
jgi:hypothetical protein